MANPDLLSPWILTMKPDEISAAIRAEAAERLAREDTERKSVEGDNKEP